MLPAARDARSLCQTSPKALISKAIFFASGAIPLEAPVTTSNGVVVISVSSVAFAMRSFVFYSFRCVLLELQIYA